MNYSFHLTNCNYIQERCYLETPTYITFLAVIYTENRLSEGIYSEVSPSQPAPFYQPSGLSGTKCQ